MRALVIGNRGDNDPGFIGERAEQVGFSLQMLEREKPGAWPALDGVDLVISLGSEWSVYWPTIAQSVDAEVALLADAHRRGTPIIGLCFGSQVLARMLGGHVERAPEAEIGWHRVEPTGSGVGSLDAGPWLQWHYDRWHLPPGAELLAASPRANQAFRVGRTLATQFHPELTMLMITNWVTGGGKAELARLGMDADDLLARSAIETVRTRPIAHRLFDDAMALTQL